ncbi:hypothetical protein SCHPADRAFT_548682 [Schizopora paradoxa]|uniref:Uncharacterized protein n=1 Tax=Schizopora paradoxa TaxID=27342 RepID=A0A0H2RE30_9AGAM|nr:hypothetical protein SCHPADRAFT_548682 [Schizopora paradoxa]
MCGISHLIPSVYLTRIVCPRSLPAFTSLRGRSSARKDADAALSLVTVSYLLLGESLVPFRHFLSPACIKKRLRIKGRRFVISTDFFTFTDISQDLNSVRWTRNLTDKWFRYRKSRLGHFEGETADPTEFLFRTTFPSATDGHAPRNG